MQKQRMILKFVVLSVVTVVFPLLAQAPKPTCNHCSATYIPKSELDAYTKRAVENKLVDQQVRSVDVGKAQVGIGMVTRGKLDPAAPSGGEAVAEHEQISEVYYIIEGSATLRTGSSDGEKPLLKADLTLSVTLRAGAGRRPLSRA